MQSRDEKVADTPCFFRPVLLQFGHTLESLNKSSSAEQRIFCPNHAVRKTGNTYSIPTFSALSLGTKSLAVSTCRFNQSFLRNIQQLLQIRWTTFNYSSKLLSKSTEDVHFVSKKVFIFKNRKVSTEACRFYFFTINYSLFALLFRKLSIR